MDTTKENSFCLENDYFKNFTSVNTQKSYRSDIGQFFNFVANKGITEYCNIERKHVIEFRNWLSELGGKHGGPSAPKTIARKLAAISSYFHYLVETSKTQFNPATSVKRPKREVKTPTNALNRDQVELLFTAIEQNRRCGKMHKALLVMFFTTGLRKSEIIRLKRNNYREINDYKIIEYVGKEGKIGQKLLHPNCIEALESYLEWMKEQNREHIGEDWLFQPGHNPTDPQNLNKPLNPKTINEIIASYAKKIGLNFNLSPHSARATFISELLEIGMDIYQVAREVNHSSVNTTQEYDKRRKKLADSPGHKLPH